MLGPLATYAEPHCYDLCSEHSERLTAPRGWEVVRLATDTGPVRPSGDDLEALANAVRKRPARTNAARAVRPPRATSTRWRSPGAGTCGSCGHRTSRPAGPGPRLG